MRNKDGRIRRISGLGLRVRVRLQQVGGTEVKCGLFEFLPAVTGKRAGLLKEGRKEKEERKENEESFFGTQGEGEQQRWKQ